METSSLLIVCILVTCSVWTVSGKSLELQIDDQKQVEVDISVNAGKLPGLCWACKWAMNKVKKSLGKNATIEKVTAKLNSVCDKIGFLKSTCRKFVTKHLPELIEELSTDDTIPMICVNTGACKSNELDLEFYPREDDESSIDELMLNISKVVCVGKK